jgi:integrase
MKMPKPHIVPLAPQAVNCLKALYEITGGEGLLFPSFTRRGKPISENTLTKALQGLGYKDRHVPHGFRRTASTILNESGWNRDWIERQLAHVEGNTVRAAYNAAEYLRAAPNSKKMDRTTQVFRWNLFSQSRDRRSLSRGIRWPK